jgi:hypothetical protein
MPASRPEASQLRTVRPVTLQIRATLAQGRIRGLSETALTTSPETNDAVSAARAEPTLGLGPLGGWDHEAMLRH